MLPVVLSWFYIKLLCWIWFWTKNMNRQPLHSFIPSRKSLKFLLSISWLPYKETTEVNSFFNILHYSYVRLSSFLSPKWAKVFGHLNLNFFFLPGGPNFGRVSQNCVRGNCYKKILLAGGKKITNNSKIFVFSSWTKKHLNYWCVTYQFWTQNIVYDKYWRKHTLAKNITSVNWAILEAFENLVRFVGMKGWK